MDVPSVIVVFVIAIIMLLFTLALIRKTYPGFLSSATCVGRGATCVDGSICPIGSHEELGLSGCTSGQRCCKSEQAPASSSTTSTTQLTSKEQVALKNGVIVTLGNNPTPLADRATLALKVSQPYTFKITVNSQLSAEKIGGCIIYVVDSKNKNQAYTLDESGDLIPLIGDITAANPCIPGESQSFLYIPTSLDTYKSLAFYAILLQKDVDVKVASHDSKLQLASKIIQLKVEPVIKFSGMSTEWTAKDDITITCNGISCNKIGLKLLRLPEGETTTYEDLLKTCIAGGNDYHYSLEYISGTTVQTSGIPLNIDIGGFRLPYQQKVLYVTSSSPIAVVNNKATVTIDKATMIRTFGAGATLTDSSPLIGDKTYLCVEARTSGTGGPYYALSDTPLRVDAFPPIIDADSGIRVVYPDPITATNLTTPYYYRQYPRIVVEGCYDFGQSGGPSGCTNYDYYIKTGNFINLNSATGDWQSGLVGLLLTEGVNSLITYFASKDAANTICPLMTSNGYTRNTNPEIRFMGAGQAIVCIRIGDKVGNTRLIWKPIWSPAEMFNRILVSSIT